MIFFLIAAVVGLLGLATLLISRRSPRGRPTVWLRVAELERENRELRRELRRRDRRIVAALRRLS